MSILENVCPICSTKNELEAVVCENCGSALEDPFLDPGARTKTTDMQALSPERIKDWLVDQTTVPEDGIGVFVEGAAHPVYTDSKGEFVIGRKVGTTSEGLFDLAPLGGYHLGISRRHAVIRRADAGYEVLDLGSANGTWLNEERLVPHQPYPLVSGSHLRLGNMRLFVLYGSFKGSK
jgi:pSer/pThr/pTyr-binding forkhead associated (FHA) protein